MDETYDVVVIGGGAAGLSGAVALARSRRSVLVLDAGDPRNAPAGHVHNFLTRDGTPPAEIYQAGRDEVRSYGGHIEAGRVTAIGREPDGFRVDVGGRPVQARRVLLATGLRDELPEVPGLAARWGIDVLHCPYCHGWEVRDQRIGVLATGPMALHQALLFRQLSPQVTVLDHVGPGFSPDQQAQLAALGINRVGGVVAEVEVEAGRLTGVRLADGSQVPLDVLVVAPRFMARAELVAPLGLSPVDVVVDQMVVGSQLEASATGESGFPGIYLAGNVSNIHAQVMTSAAGGLAAGAAINADLVMADAHQAVHQHHHEQVVGEEAWDERYRSRPQAWSGDPNPALVAEVADLTPGTALDAGAGEGGDAFWLAAGGWKVTGVDISSVALERAAARARKLSLDISWVQSDLSLEPAAGTFDLVTAHFLHLPQPSRQALFSHLADAVAPGGTLLIVGHDPTDTGVLRPHLAEMGWTADEVADSLGADWVIEVKESRPRQVSDEDGNKITIRDAVLRARRDSHGATAGA